MRAHATPCLVFVSHVLFLLTYFELIPLGKRTVIPATTILDFVSIWTQTDGS